MTTLNNKYKLIETGIYKNEKTSRYLAMKKVKRKKVSKTFDLISDARRWRKNSSETKENYESKKSSLADVWAVMNEKHFPTLAPSTQEIWIRRYFLLKDLEHLKMDQISTQSLYDWVSIKVKHFRSDEYLALSRGNAKRCNLDNELNLLSTIFNWYLKKSRDFEEESVGVKNPVYRDHKLKGFIKPKPVRKRAITLEYALKFFNYLKPLYRDLAQMQFYTAGRIGEVSGIQWNRVDFVNRTLTIMETCQWDMTHKTFVALNPHPKNKEPRVVYMTDEIYCILKRREPFKLPGNNFVFHVEGAPLNYSTIQLNYREAQRKGDIPFSGTHILRHGMATLARKIGGGLDAVIAMTGHKDFKLADHYSKLDADYQKEVSQKVMHHMRSVMHESEPGEHPNVLKMSKFTKSM